MPSLVTSTDICIDVPIHWDLPDVPAGTDWQLDLAADDGGILEYGSGPSHGHDAILWCSSDMPGEHYVSGTIEYLDEDGTSYEDVISLVYKIQKMNTKATIRPGRQSPRVDQVFTLKGCVTAGGKRQTFRKAAIEYHWPGKSWRRLKYTYTDTVGCYEEATVSPSDGVLRIRIRVPADDLSKAGYSKTIKVKVRK
ncbi:hypothetical protein KIH74_22800 [Kineosporia sp. J2-2]|uniref:Ig-like domain-containing protein n=1 Tax=Kineosporia corallincola TaxID=2835133 RepID=A0ABS5TLR5_9ACTN|nr:hypothetical protein [Kineosporia corallincola]MBT0771788.1 hypothetical protein [Kineosporia corallincola]